MPIWYIIGEVEAIPTAMYGVWRIYEVHATTVAQVQAGKFNERIRHYQAEGNFRVQILMVARELDNPFRDWQNQ